MPPTCDAASFQRRLLGLQFRIWAIAGVVLLMALAIAAVLWALDKGAFPGAWEESNNIGFHDPQVLTGASGKALADVEKKILELRTEGSGRG